jgi:hypothetical protein
MLRKSTAGLLLLLKVLSRKKKNFRAINGIRKTLNLSVRQYFQIADVRVSFFTFSAHICISSPKAGN